MSSTYSTYVNLKSNDFVCVWDCLRSLFFLLFSLFLVLFMGLIALFGTIHDLIVLFQLLFNFIYSTFSKKNSVSAK